MTRRILRTYQLSRSWSVCVESHLNEECRDNPDQIRVWARCERKVPAVSANSRGALRRMTQTQSFSPFLICVVFDLCASWQHSGVPLIAYAPTAGYARAATPPSPDKVGARRPRLGRWQRGGCPPPCSAATFCAAGCRNDSQLRCTERSVEAARPAAKSFSRPGQSQEVSRPSSMPHDRRRRASRSRGQRRQPGGAAASQGCRRPN
jgi:hypothetical protein